MPERNNIVSNTSCRVTIRVISGEILPLVNSPPASQLLLKEKGIHMKIRDLPKSSALRGTKFKLPTGEEVYWYSQWGYPDGKAGIWYKKDMKESQVHPFFLDELIEALDYEVIDSDKNNKIGEIDDSSRQSSC